MALTMDWMAGAGYIIPAAYLRINNVAVYHGPDGNQPDQVRIEVCVYASEAVRHSDNPETVENPQFWFNYDDQSPLSFSQWYGLLKTQEQFIGAEDA